MGFGRYRRVPLGPGLVVVALAAALAAFGRDAWRHLTAERLTGAAVAIDGDSLRLDGRELRLEGLDAPEYRQTCRRGDRDEPCGRQAREALAAWLASGPVACAVASVDRYGRGLALCTAGGREINAALVRDGMAVAYGRYEAEEAQARRAGRGVWGTRFEAPAEWRARHPRGDLAAH